jgi:hypothetical protein
MSVTSGGTAPNGFSAGGRSSSGAGAVPHPDRRGQVLDADHHADEAVLPGRVVRGPQLERHLVLVAEVHRLNERSFCEIPEVQPVPVLAPQQQLRVDPVLDHVGRAPLRGDEHVAGQVPPEVVREELVPAFGFPLTPYVKGGVVENSDTARSGPTVPCPQRRDVDAVRSAVDGVRARIVGFVRQLLRRDLLDQARVARIVLRVQHVDPRGAQSRHDQIAPFHVRMRRRRAKRAAACVPPEMVQLVTGVRKIGPADDLAIVVRRGIGADHGDRVRLLGGSIERRHVGQLFSGSIRGVTRRCIERGVWGPPGHAGHPAPMAAS